MAFDVFEQLIDKRVLPVADDGQRDGVVRHTTYDEKYGYEFFRSLNSSARASILTRWSFVAGDTA
jgi:hypothetical protein